MLCPPRADLYSLKFVQGKMENQKFKNRLSEEISPYLLQHANNPVDWHPWGPEALAIARKEGKPIFLSIGYSSCHWCHVMAHESFENEETARIMNELFVNIKVDREERPDIDAIYMKAVILMNGHGGWPMSVFLTPDQEPYFGGTYFPPAPKYNRPGFPQILQEASDLYRNQKTQLQSRSKKLLENMNKSSLSPRTDPSPVRQLITRTVELQAERFDETHGGFGSGMKFPEPMLYSLLLRHWFHSESNDALMMADKSLTKMAEGGIYDQLGGGFHRYSTDRKWLAPHFEKMLYDNALLAKLYLESFQATKQEVYQRIPEGIFDYVRREMTAPEGGFYSSQDADTEGSEGTYFLWDMKEVLDLLGPRNAKVFSRAYGITATGNFERRNILHVKDSLEKISKEEGIPIFEVDHIVKTGKKALFDVREQRSQPGRDDKILTGWNGLMITALATGYSVLRQQRALDAAVQCGEFIWKNMWIESALFRVFKEGEVRVNGCLEDYAYLLEGFLALYEASFNTIWLERSTQLASTMIAKLWDEKSGGFFISDNDALVARLKNPEDEAVPSGNAVAAMSLSKLGHLTGKPIFAEKGRATVQAFRDEIEHRPTAFCGLLAALDFQESSQLEIVLAGDIEDPVYKELLEVVTKDYRPQKLVAGYRGEESVRWIPWMEGRKEIAGKPTVYVCKGQTCHPPVHTAEALDNLLGPPPRIQINIFDEEKKIKDMQSREQDQFLNAMSSIFKYSGLGKK